MLEPAKRPSGQKDQNYVVRDENGHYYKVSPGNDEETLNIQRTVGNEPVLHDYSEVHKLGGHATFSYGRFFSDKRLNGPTFIWEDGDGMFYNPAGDCFVPEIDETCIMTQDEATDALGSRFANDASAQMHQFSKLQLDIFPMKDDPDADGELLPVTSMEEATKFNVSVRVDYMPGHWTRAGESDVLETTEGLELAYADMFTKSVKNSYPGANAAVVLEPVAEVDDEPSGPRFG